MTQTVVAPSEEGTSRYAQAGPHRLHYHEAGQGAAVVMLHGGGPGATAWSNFGGNIGPFAQQHRTLLVDMLGFGGSDSVVFDSEPATTVRARALRDLLDTLGIEKASFVGNSMGASTAMAFAVDHPERTERLVLVGAAGKTRTVIAPQPTDGHRRLAEAGADPSVTTMRALVDTMLFDPGLMSAAALESRVRAARNPAHRDAAARSTAPWRDQTDEFARIAARTLIVWGREDRVNPLEIGLLLLRDIPDSRLHVFRDCGHWAQIEHETEFNRVALEFLAAA
ncbi:alpha/beta fold hydrolase [Pseudonocardia benzenivorans]|uniref:Alpha/beta fold hydrolase n=1 Tax=Pseudonocardia benzenivorans TaxID=228005 RepID=A0ABW3VQ21_9PSEU|nr:alpha/beta fold hydrolase [Pseudonocardia sp.]